MYFFTKALWIINIILQGWLLGLVLRDSSYRRYPAFFTYISFCVLCSLLLFFIAQHMDGVIYFWLYWYSAFLEFCLLLLVAHEIFAKSFKPYHALPRNVIRNLSALLLLVIVLCCALVVYRPSTYAGEHVAIARTFERSFTLFLAAVFFSVTFLALYFGEHCQRRLFGIGAGFIFYACIHAITAILKISSLHNIAELLDRLRMFAFFVALLMWIRVFRIPEPPRVAPTEEQMRRLIEIMVDTRKRINKIADSLNGFRGNWKTASENINTQIGELIKSTPAHEQASK